jgi:hypothetical protein
MNTFLHASSNEMWQLQFHSGETPIQDEARPKLPPATLGYHLFSFGTTACRVGQRIVRDVLERTHERIAASYGDYPIPSINPINARLANGETVDVPGEPFCPIGEPGERRDRANQYALLRPRYEELLRDIPVWADRKLGVSGEGGGAIPAVAAIDIDLNIQRINAFIAEQLRWLQREQARAGGVSDFGHIVEAMAQQDERARRQWIIPVIFGGSGATGNACGQLMPYLIRLVLREMNISNCQLWGIALGPTAFKGLTPHVMNNYQSLLRSLDHMARRGLRREFINGLTLDMAQPPYDQLVLIDDATLPTDGLGRVTEAGMDEFVDRVARIVRVMLTSDVWDRVASHTVNPDFLLPDDGKLRWITLINAATCAVNKSALIQQATAFKQAQLLKNLAKRLAA